LNITAVFSANQVSKIAACIGASPSVIISIFAGRIADTGIDPKPIMIASKKVVKDLKNTKILWASARELFNAVEAKACGCNIITITPDLLDKFKLWGTDLNEYSRKTAEQFYKDAKAAQLTI
jgi:transaldolase